VSSPDNIPLFQAFPALARQVPRQSIGHWPTPVTHLARFGRDLGLPHLYIKRDDLSHPECGGNKIRGIEFLLADALKQRSKSILTMGAAGSHHVARTAWHAAKLGISTTAVLLRQPMAEYVRRNLLLASSVGANLVKANPLTIIPRLAALRYLIINHPYFIPPGGTTPLTCLGHVNAAFELKQQVDRRELPAPDHIYVPLGSLGTGAGLLLGARLAGLRARLVGVVTSYRWYATAKRVTRLANKTLALMRQFDPSVPQVRVVPADIDIVASSLGRGYARFSERSIQLAQQLFALESIDIDGTYAAKVLDGACEFIRVQSAAEQVHVFWNTYHRLQVVPSNEPLKPWVARYLQEPSQLLDARIERTDRPHQS